MIFFVIDFFKQFLGIKVPVAFGYYSTRMMLAAMTSLLLSICLGPYFIKKLYELKIGQSIRTDECPLLGQLHHKKKDTPTMGGALLLCTMLVSMFLWMDLTHVFTLILFITTLFLGFVGGRDDYLKLKYKNTKGLSGKKKLLCQALLGGFLALYLLSSTVAGSLQMGSWYAPPVIKEPVAAVYQEMGPSLSSQNLAPQNLNSQQLTPYHMLPGSASSQTATTLAPLSLKEYASRIYVPFFKDPVVLIPSALSLLTALFIMVVVAGTSNSVNLTDGLDGLAAGCLIMVASCLGLIAFISNHVDLAGYLNIVYIEGSGEIAIYLSAFVGACIGFLWYNGHPAQVFMGDTGSLALGGVLGVCAVLLKREPLLAVVGGVFVAEAVSVILQVASFRLRNKKRIFLCTPLHHHFEYQGWPETKVVIRFWIVGLLLAILGLASLKLQ